MILSQYYNRIQDGILTENLEGVYVKRAPSKCAKSALALGILNFALFISSLYTYLGVHMTNIPYTENTKATMYLPNGTTYMYIDIDGIHQNYSSYAKSINYNQLKGKAVEENLEATSPFDYNNENPYYPAGAIAATYFQDTVKIDGLDISTTGITRSVNKGMIGFSEYQPNQISIPQNWTSTTNYNTEPLNTFSGSGLPILNERFLNWVLIAPFSSFKKLWGKLEVKESGYYNVFISSKYDIAKRKGILFSEKSVLGIPNYYSSILFLVVGLLSMAAAIYLQKFGY